MADVLLSIGVFAGLGRVSVRMLRHWDSIGLLTPAHVDEWTGYRSYDPAQLAVLNRIIALRELGFGLDDVATMLAGSISDERVEQLLQARRELLQHEHALALARLTEVERRLTSLKENPVPTIEIVHKPLPPVRLAARTAVVDDPVLIGNTVEGLFDAVESEIGAVQGALDTPIAQYRATDDGMEITAGYVWDGPAGENYRIVELPAQPQAACAVHLGDMSSIRQTWHAVHQQLTDQGFVPSGPCRELYVRAEGTDQSDWVTELQQPVTRG